MGILSRRKLLLMALGGGTVARIVDDRQRDYQSSSQQQARQQALGEDTSSIIDTAYNLEADWDIEIAERQAVIAATQLQYPLMDYNRDKSKWMIQSCKLAVQQYKTGRSNPNYDGALTLLPDYNANFQNYRQLASLKIEEDILENYFQLPEAIVATDGEENMMSQTVQDAESKIREVVRNIARRRHRQSLYIGFIIASPTNNIIAFRGTQTQLEWWQNLQVAQRKYFDPKTRENYGRVHQGYLNLVRNQISTTLKDAVSQLNPKIPCFITGHSLGGAVATLVAMEIALNFPEFRPQLQLYSYASPRIGDRLFAQAHSRLIPNSYRVTNTSDSVPLIPPIKIQNPYADANYAHVGQKWSFSTQYGDVLLNHVVDTYRTAIENEVETMATDTLNRMM